MGNFHFEDWTLEAGFVAIVMLTMAALWFAASKT
jgi:hypothetical protein